MSLKASMANGLLAHEGLHALACVDVESGALLGIEVRDESAREALDLATQAATQLCIVPRLDPLVEGEDERARAALVVSESAVHFYALSRGRSTVVVVGVAGRAANVGLLLAAVRSIADSLVDEEAQ